MEYNTGKESEMSLVANYTSSEEDSENEVIIDTKTKPKNFNANTKPSTSSKPAQYSDDSDAAEDDENEGMTTTLSLNLPKPLKSTTNQLLVEEVDDEFLHKTANPSEIKKPPPKKTAAKIVKPRQPVKIIIPSLSNFDRDFGPTVSNAIVAPQPAMRRGLVNLLPPPQKNLGSASGSATSSSSIKSSMIPHAVKKQFDSKKDKPKLMTPTAAATSSKSTMPGISNNSSESEDSDAEDFFSLNDDRKLPEVSANEIQNMVARKSAKLAAASNKLNQELEQRKRQAEEGYAAQQALAARQSAYSAATLQRDMDIQALCGSRAKRGRQDDIEFIELSHEEVLPKRDDWLRSQLAAQTEYQPKGLVGYEDPGSGTKRKHQITYLAYQAKANEAELQAMWAANRQSRKQTQGKYGF